MFLRGVLVWFLVLVGLVFCGSGVLGRELKELDGDVVYDEGRVPGYDLPSVLWSSVLGREVVSAEEWFGVRRPEILSLFGNLVYGCVPAPFYGIEVSFDVVKVDGGFMGGLGRRKDVVIRFGNEVGEREMYVLVFVPNGVEGRVPVFLLHSFDDTRSGGFDVSEGRVGWLRNGLPLGEVLGRGYGLCVVYHEDLVGHNEVEFLDGIHGLFYGPGQSFPKAHEWGVLSVCAWGAMRAMDYLEVDEDVDAGRVAVMGHSKMGKAALWTAAQDERFGLAISAQSGCAGAALWRRRFGETLGKMVTRFPYWLARNAWKFVGREDDLPVDQHMLLACIAPRPVYVHSSVGDSWADPRGEYLSAYFASEVYGLLGGRGLVSEELPKVGEAVVEGDVGYHIREGGHSVELYDWRRFLDFADYHFKR